MDKPNRDPMSKNENELEKRLEALEAAVHRKSNKQPENSGPSLAELNAVARRHASAIRAEQMSAAAVAKRAIEAAFNPTQRQKAAMAKATKPLTDAAIVASADKADKVSK